VRTDFPGYYRPTEGEFAELWKHCVFILEANILPDLYRFPKKLRNDLIKVIKFTANANRLCIPHQVALEYQENRLIVIAEQVKRFGEVRDLLKKFKDDFGRFEDKLNRLKLEKRHSAIGPKDFLEKVRMHISDFEATLDQLETEQPYVLDEDPLCWSAWQA
jgi:hypothetical protein